MARTLMHAQPFLPQQVIPSSLASSLPELPVNRPVADPKPGAEDRVLDRIDAVLQDAAFMRSRLTHVSQMRRTAMDIDRWEFRVVPVFSDDPDGIFSVDHIDPEVWR